MSGIFINPAPDNGAEQDPLLLMVTDMRAEVIAEGEHLRHQLETADSEADAIALSAVATMTLERKANLEDLLQTLNR